MLLLSLDSFPERLAVDFANFTSASKNKSKKSIIELLV